MGIFYKNNNFELKKYKYEKDFEDMIFDNSSLFFGNDTILVDTKTKISGLSLGKTIPDGFLFDFSDKDEVKFYIIEVELAHHGFYRHIFPQITKFFSFLRNGNPHQSELVEKLYNIISSDAGVREQFAKYIGKIELYKFLKDTIENSQDILILIDEYLKEFDDIRETYTDTWDKYVKILKVEEYIRNDESIFSITPDFNDVASEIDIDAPNNDDNSNIRYTEEFHLEDKSDLVKQTYRQIKDQLGEYTFNPQRYYISIRNHKNFAFLKFTKKYITVVAMLPEKEVSKIIKGYQLKTPSLGVQGFYNGPCTYILIKNLDNVNEVVKVIKKSAKEKV